MSTRTFTICVLLALSLLTATTYAAADWLPFFGLLFLVLFSLGFSCWLGLSGLLKSEEWKTRRAERRITEAKLDEARRRALSELTIAPPYSQVYQVLLEGDTIKTKALHLESGDDVAKWAHFNSRNNSQSAIELPNAPQLQAPIPESVLLDYYVSQPTVRNIFLGVGRFPDGQVKPVSAPLSRLVNIAIGGGSGFGKSVFMQSLAYQIINAREDVTPVFLDGQGVTFTEWYGNSRLLYPLASKPDDILTILLALIVEMTRREALFGTYRGVDGIEKYNSIPGIVTLPLIPILFDEFGIVTDDKRIADAAKKIAKAGRKVGMPSVSSDQTWLAADISSAYRANLSTSFQFYVRSKSVSRILIGDSGAVDLLRPGQCLAALPGQPGLIEMQAPDVSNLIGGTPQLIEVIPSADEIDPDDLFIELVAQGESRNAASKRAWGRPYAGDRVERGKRLLGEI